MRIYLQINGKYIKYINKNYKYKKYFCERQQEINT